MLIILIKDINPSRRGESSLSERLSLNMELMIENDCPNVSKANDETQTSPEFVRNSRQNSKNMQKLERHKNVQNGRFNPQNDQNFDHNISKTFSQNLYRNQNSNQELNDSSKAKTFATPSHNPNIKSNSKSKTPKTKQINEMKSSEVEKYSQKDFSQNETINTNRRDALQEYAETLLRETALMVNNENIRQESIENEKQLKKGKTPERLAKMTPKNSPMRQTMNSVNEESQQKSKTPENYRNELNDKNVINTETETEDEQEVQQNNPQKSPQKSPIHMKTEINSVGPKLKAIANFSDKNDETTPKRQIKEQPNNPTDNLRDGTDIPDSYLKLKWV